MVIMIMTTVMGVNVLFREERDGVRNTCYQCPRWNLVSSVGVGISSSPFPNSLRNKQRKSQTPKKEGKAHSNMRHGDFSKRSPMRLCGRGREGSTGAKRKQT